MKLELFINFDGNCREAVEFYPINTENIKVFNDASRGPVCKLFIANNEKPSDEFAQKNCEYHPEYGK